MKEKIKQGVFNYVALCLFMWLSKTGKINSRRFKVLG